MIPLKITILTVRQSNGHTEENRQIRSRPQSHAPYSDHEMNYKGIPGGPGRPALPSR
jgi:hypothetical protein